jgi:CheY-like chemotaxis protein
MQSNAGRPVETADISLALVAGRSPVNRVVISRIAERLALKVLSEDPEAALRVLRRRHPGLVILDGGADNRDCDGLLPVLAEQRLLFPDGLPLVVLLSNQHAPRESVHCANVVDAVVAKPVMPETLQPALHSLLERIGRR